jgi:hypothetical protein
MLREVVPWGIGELKLCQNIADSGLVLHADMEPNKSPLAGSQILRKTWIGGGLISVHPHRVYTTRELRTLSTKNGSSKPESNGIV